MDFGESFGVFSCGGKVESREAGQVEKPEILMNKLLLLPPH
jgi:hypothetical protein